MKNFALALTAAAVVLCAGQAHAQAAIMPGGAAAPAPSAKAAPTAAAGAVALAPVTPAANPNAIKVKAEVNPATGRLVVKTDNPGPTRIEVSDAGGRPVLTYSMMNGQTPAELNVSQLPAGAYIVRCLTKDKAGMRRVMLGQ